jgi:hypothetical protein
LKTMTTAYRTHNHNAEDDLSAMLSWRHCWRCQRDRVVERATERSLFCHVLVRSRRRAVPPSCGSVVARSLRRAVPSSFGPAVVRSRRRSVPSSFGPAVVRSVPSSFARSRRSWRSWFDSRRKTLASNVIFPFHPVVLRWRQELVALLAGPSSAFMVMDTVVGKCRLEPSLSSSNCL